MAEEKKKIKDISNKVIEIETEYHERKGVATCCGLCGISFSHIHPKGSLPKDFIKAELECPFCLSTPCKKSTVGCMHDGEVEVKGPEICGRCNKPKGKEGDPVYLSVAGMVCKCGRPTDYTEETLAKAREYLDLSMPNKETDEEFHSIAGLAVYLGIARVTVHAWAKEADKKEFSYIYEGVMAKQEKRIINKGTKGDYSAPMSKLMLTKHGYRDAVDNFNREVPVDPEAKKMADDAIEGYLNTKK